MNHEEKVATAKGVAVWAAWMASKLAEYGGTLAALFTLLLIIDHIWRRYIKKIIHGTFMDSDKGELDK